MMIWRRVWMVVGSLVAAAGLHLGLRPPPPEKALLQFLETEYAQATEVILYSLDPQARWERTEGEASKLEQFWNCDVLGKVPLKDAGDRESARMAISDSVRGVSQEASVACIFEPRHAFRITTQEQKVVTIALCYECGEVAFAGIRSRGSKCNICESGHESLNALQDKYKLSRNIAKESDT
jgi:hypothetical protein